jgi:hypothetical protein
VAIGNLHTEKDLERFVNQMLDQPGAVKQPAVQGLPDALAALNPPYLSVIQNAAPADADIATGELTIWFDDTIGASKAMFKGKDSAGTVVTGSVALA